MEDEIKSKLESKAKEVAWIPPPAPLRLSQKSTPPGCLVCSPMLCPALGLWWMGFRFWCRNIGYHVFGGCLATTSQLVCPLQRGLRSRFRAPSLWPPLVGQAGATL